MGSWTNWAIGEPFEDVADTTAVLGVVEGVGGRVGAEVGWDNTEVGTVEWVIGIWELWDIEICE